MKNLGDELKYQREINGLTQSDLANATEIRNKR